VERVALAERDHVLGKRPRSLRAGERGSDALPLDEVGDQIAQGGPAMSGFASEFESCIEVSHGFSRAYKPAVSSGVGGAVWLGSGDRKSTRLNSSHRCISYAVFCLKKKKKQQIS